MREVIEELLETWSTGQDTALATVVSTYRSAPRQPGAVMLVHRDGSVLGSLSGGCVESDVYELGRDVLAGSGAVLRSYGVSDDDALAVGLTCGGEITVFIDRIGRDTFPHLDEVATSVRQHRPVAVATVVTGPRPVRGQRVLVWSNAVSGTTGSAIWDQQIADDARACLVAGRARLVTYDASECDRPGQMQVFIDALIPPPRLLVLGATDFATALTRLGAAAGYQVTVCDARAIFTTPQRFPDAHEVVVDWPHRYLADEASAGRIDGRTAVCVLTHDPKFDVPVLSVALHLSSVGYVGVMGSRRTHSDRIRRFREAGTSNSELERMSSPLGLDIGAATPAETAISILADVIASASRRSGRPLRDGVGPIHNRPSDIPRGSFAQSSTQCSHSVCADRLENANHAPHQ